MIIVDKALAAREAAGNPIRVGMIGPGFQGKAVALQFLLAAKGMRLCVIAGRRIDQARAAYTQADVEPVVCETQSEIEQAIADGTPAITENAEAMCRAEGLDAIVDVTGSIDFAARMILAAIETGKHVIQINAELDATIGPLLKKKADDAGVIYTFSEGDQPGVVMNLARFAEGIGLTPRLAGNIKGLHDPYRNPTTQQGYAEKWGQKAHMVASFADGTKIAFEQAITANGLGFKVAKRGMVGPDFSGGDPYAPLVPLSSVVSSFEDYLADDQPGIVDYVVGADPGPGVFLLCTIENETQRHFLKLYKMGDGPFYCLYTPYHLCHFELPSSVARAVLFNDATLAPIGGPEVGVIAVAKKDLSVGETIEDFGGYQVYGLAENYSVMESEDLLPISLALGCKVVRNIAKDKPVTFSDVEIPPNRVIDGLYAEQRQMFANPRSSDREAGTRNVDRRDQISGSKAPHT